MLVDKNADVPPVKTIKINLMRRDILEEKKKLTVNVQKVSV